MKRAVILCVDDERSVLISLKDQLKHYLEDQYSIETAESAEEALDVFQEVFEDKSEIAVIIADHIMPGIKGDELLIQIHKLAPKTLKIMLTGQANAEAVGNVVNYANLYRYIAKPWQETDLVLTVKEAMKSYFQEKKLEEQNLMLQETNTKLTDLNKQLNEYTRTLEEKVAERTAELEKVNRELQSLANLDGLTHIANRRQFDKYFAQEWQRYVREQLPLSLIFCDIDYFKRYNDTYGHQAGDDCLKQIAQAMTAAVKRPTDLVARYGGEEFMVVLPATDIEGALHVAQTIQKAIQSLVIEHAESSVNEYITLSMGISCVVPNRELSPDDLVTAADQALYKAKEEGRDRIILKTL